MLRGRGIAEKESIHNLLQRLLIMSGIPNYAEHTRAISANLAALRSDHPDLMKGFNDMAAAATRDGVLSKKTKELIALALGVAAHCDACIGFHAKALVHLGATLEEVEETLGMAVYMGGGPSLMYSANALAAFKEFQAQKSA
jgi:AhpD family alkylhydroperoxidase